MGVLGKKDVPVIDDFEVFSGNNAITGLTVFTFELWDPTGTDVSATIIPVVTELGGGSYRVTFTPNMVGDWLLVVYNNPYFKSGKRQNYQVFEQLFDDIVENLGPGDRSVKINIEDDSTLMPIVGAWIEIWNSGLTARIAFGYSQSDGSQTFMLFDGSYKVYVSKIGDYVFSGLPYDLTVSSNPPPPDVEVTYQGTEFDPGAPPAPDMCVVYGWEWDAQSGPHNVDVVAKIVGDDNFHSSNPHINVTEITVTPDPLNQGYWAMPLLRSGSFASGPRTVLYEFTIGDYVKTVEIPDQPNVAFSSLVDP
jgi:hypothetical protein